MILRSHFGRHNFGGVGQTGGLQEMVDCIIRDGLAEVINWKPA